MCLSASCPRRKGSRQIDRHSSPMCPFARHPGMRSDRHEADRAGLKKERPFEACVVKHAWAGPTGSPHIRRHPLCACAEVSRAHPTLARVGQRQARRCLKAHGLSRTPLVARASQRTSELHCSKRAHVYCTANSSRTTGAKPDEPRAREVQPLLNRRFRHPVHVESQEDAEGDL
jgi:hypothetical protein